MRFQKDARMQCLSNEAGFTLLEIIAVIVILSILAVVAVPRYFDLQTEARKRAMSVGLAEALGRVNGHFAAELLNGTSWNAISYTTTDLGSDLGDFTLSVDDAAAAAGGADTFWIEVAGNTGTPLNGMTLGTYVKRPGSP